MKAFVKSLAALVLVLAPAAMAPVGVAWAQPWRGERRSEAQGAPRGGLRGFADRVAPRAYRPPMPAAPYRGRSPYPYVPVYPAPVPAPPAYAAPPYGYRPAAPNSLGADWGQQQNQARRGVRQGGLMSLDRVIPMLNSQIAGRLLDAGLEPGPGGRPAYRVRWAARGGRRIDFIVDAATGQILGRSGY